MSEKTPADILVSKLVDLTCAQCSQPFVLEYPTLAKFVTVCPKCSEAQVKAEFKADAAKAHRFDEGAWRRFCPLTFHETDPKRLPKLPAVLAWKFGARGLLLHGKTGSGKSRCLYELLKREFTDQRDISVLDHSTAYEYADAYGESPAKGLAWVERRAGVAILALDDVFKAKLTDSFEQALFTVISQRTERGKPVLVTTNDVGDSLISRMSLDRGPALVRRLREFCDKISF